jgi:hypothetical protein
MDPQAPNVPETLKAEGPERVVSRAEPRVERDNHWLSILAMAIFILFALGVVAFLYYQNQQLKKMLINYQPTPSSSPNTIVSPSPNSGMPNVSSPSANMKVVSPLKIAGTVPAGWMFEGIFPIKLVDSNRKLIVQGQAKEKVAGSWQSGLPIEFTATLVFKSASGSGFLILQNDNPSGLPTNSKSLEVPVSF